MLTNRHQKRLKNGEISPVAPKPKSTKLVSGKSILQLAHQAKYGAALRFIQTFDTTFRLSGFPFEGAIKHMVRNAFIGEYPFFEIDYSKILLTDGPLDGLVPVKTSFGGEGIEFRWSASANQGHILMIAHFPEINKSIHSDQQCTRPEGQLQLPIPFLSAGYAETWIAFTFPYMSAWSPSIYAGRVEIPPKREVI